MGCGGAKSKEEPPLAAKKKGPDASQAADKDKDKKDNKQANKGFNLVIDFCKNVPLFKSLPQDKLPILAESMDLKEFKSGNVLFKQGDSGEDFYVIKDGEATVTQDGNEVAKLGPKDFFGEASLLRDDPRTATITASKNLEVYMISRQKFESLGLKEFLNFPNRKALGAGKAAATCLVKPPTPKTKQDEDAIMKALTDNIALSGVVSLDQAKMKALIAIAWKEDIDKGTEVVKEGDADANYFYIVSEGKFQVTSTGDGDAKSGDKPAQVLTTVTKGGSFGELALLYLTPRAATVTAQDKGVVWVIDRMNFKKILMQVSTAKLENYAKLIDGVEAMATLSAAEKKQVANAMVEMHFSKDEVIVQQGEKGSTFYLLYEGTVSIVQDGKEVAQLDAQKAASPKAKYFGEKALKDDEVRGATVKVVSTTAKALALDRHTFNLALGSVQDAMDAQAQGHKRISALPIQRKDLQKIGLLGCGGFGTVELWEHKTTEMTFAMKALSKGYIVKTGMQDSVMNEKNILMMTNSEFIVKLHETYNGAQSLYFLLEPALGGELYATYNRKGLHGQEKHAKFYISATVYAFEHCHERHIIYRDLKPENLLLTITGHLKLTDMGLAKFVIGKTFTTCGTPDYFAPEIIASTGHTDAVDWWMLGILLYELLSGRPPFESAYPMQTYSKVMKGISKVNFPAKCQGMVQPLIMGLLKREPSERLPCRPGGTQNVKDSKWYQGFSWDDMKQGKVDPPYKPNVKSKKDIANFSARKEDMPKQLEYKDDGSGWDKAFASSQ